MTEAQARKHLRQMLQSLTPGSVLHLLSDLFARAARRGDETTRKQAQEVATALFVVGLGVDAASPR
jgi:hypothetical protein